MKIIIEIPIETYEYWKSLKGEYLIGEALANGEVIESEDK